MRHQNSKEHKSVTPSSFYIFVANSPFHTKYHKMHGEVGMSLQDVLAVSVPDKLYHPYAAMLVNGHVIKPDLWSVTYPKATDTISVQLVPQGGGGGKNPLQAILAIAVAVVAPQIGLAYGTMAATSFTTAANILGKMAINAIAPPSKPKLSKIDQGEKPAYFIEGARNTAHVFGGIPKVLGTHRMVPPLAAAPYTETVGDQQYLRMLFCWGYGPVSISDLKIGETSIDAFDDVEIEHRYGYEDDEDITLYSQSVVQNDLNIALQQETGYVMRTTAEDADEISVDLTFPRGLVRYSASGKKKTQQVNFEVQYSKTGENQWSNAVETYRQVEAQSIELVQSESASSQRIDAIAIDPISGKAYRYTGNAVHIESDAPVAATVPSGQYKIAELKVLGNGFSLVDKRASTLFGDIFQDEESFKCQLETTSHGFNRKVTKITISSGGVRFKGIEIKAQQSRAMRQSYSFKVEKGQYDVRIRRLTDDELENTSILDETYWTALRVMRYEHPVQKKTMALTALRILATDQLNGVIDQLNGVVSAIIPDWDAETETWVARPSSNPASLYKHVLQGAENDKPLSNERIDLDRLKEWHQHCAIEGRTYNGIIEGEESVQDVLQNIAAAGRASPTIMDGKWSIVEDRAQDIPVQLFTPRNSFGFEAERHYDDMPHGLRVRFLNETKNWLEDEYIIYDDGYDKSNATYFETLELPGVTNPDQIWRDGRYHLAALRLRPETFTFNTDIEHIVCTRGDLIHFAHDVPLIGLISGRVSARVINENGHCVSVTLDTVCEMEQGDLYGLRCRLADGRCLYHTLSVAPENIQTKELSFEAPILAMDAPDIGDLVTFGAHEREVMPLIIRSIEPQEELTARLTCVPAAPEIYDADKGSIPSYDTVVTIPRSLKRPPIPEIIEIQSGADLWGQDQTLSYTPMISLRLVQNAAYDVTKTHVLIRAEGEEQYYPSEMQALSPYDCIIRNVVEGAYYDLKIIHDTGAGVMSPALYINNYMVIGLSDKPSDVTGFGISILGDTAHLSWDAITDLDLSHYRLKFSPALSGATWGGSVDLVAKISKPSTSITTPAAIGSYLIKAVDQGGRESENATIISTNVVNVLGLNNVATLNETVFNGTRENTIIVNGGLRLGGSDMVDDWGVIDDVANMDIGEGTMQEEGLYYFQNSIDLGAVYTSTLSANMQAHGVQVFDYIDHWGHIDAHSDIDGDNDAEQWEASIELRMTNDNPVETPVWSEWQNFIIGDYTARAYEFRIVLGQFSEEVSPHVQGVEVKIDMPDRTTSGENITSGLNAFSVLFEHAFQAVPAIGISIENMQTGDYYTITNKTTAGFDIQFFNQSGTAVSRIFDYVAKGYGQIHT